ncbi:hypothetical protein CWS02_10900 [Enterobacter sp. EA-1]|nr:hypothetical protein CWS02_10900 [Enterobacter sp. EA-1]
MEFIDGTVIATALPDMAKTFGVEAVALNIGISAYLITLAVLIPASGWIADRFGAQCVLAGATDFHRCIGAVRVVHQRRYVCVNAYLTGHWRRADGTRWPACRTAHYAKTSINYCHRHADSARTGRADHSARR